MPRLTLTVALALALTPAAVAHAAAPGLAPLASLAAGRAITVTCTVPASAPEAGYTVVGGNEIWITASACRALSHLTRRDAWARGTTDSVSNTDLAGDAIQVLVHEATHLRLASADEALVECTASRNYWPVIASLHLPARIARLVFASALATHRNLSNPLYKTDC